LIKNFHNNLNLIHVYANDLPAKQPSKFEPYGVVYNFTFVSLIAPYLLNDLRISNVTSAPSTPNKSTILIKQSYLLFTWFYYLKTSVIRGGTKNKIVKFSFLPIRRKSYTLTKAPMAHKTNSKEQFVFKFYKFKASIRTYFVTSYRLTSVDQSMSALFLTKKTFPHFETNVLLLKHSTVYLAMNDPLYFNYQVCNSPNIYNHKVL